MEALSIPSQGRTWERLHGRYGLKMDFNGPFEISFQEKLILGNVGSYTGWNHSVISSLKIEAMWTEKGAEGWVVLFSRWLESFTTEDIQRLLTYSSAFVLKTLRHQWMIVSSSVMSEKKNDK